MPPLVNAVALPLIGAPLSRKVTFPVGVPPPEAPCTTAVNVTGCPVAEGFFTEGARAVADGRRFPDCTITVWLPVLFAGFVSGFDELTDAVFETGPAVDGSVRTSEIVAEAPLVIVPSEQVTVEEPLQLP